MEINQLRTFYEIAKAKSYSNASKSLFITHSAVSHPITNLKKEVATPLGCNGQNGVSKTLEESQRPKTEVLSELCSGPRKGRAEWSGGSWTFDAVVAGLGDDLYIMQPRLLLAKSSQRITSWALPLISLYIKSRRSRKTHNMSTILGNLTGKK